MILSLLTCATILTEPRLCSFLFAFALAYQECRQLMGAWGLFTILLHLTSKVHECTIRGKVYASRGASPIVATIEKHTQTYVQIACA
jgi:hypothetical protein